MKNNELVKWRWLKKLSSSKLSSVTFEDIEERVSTWQKFKSSEKSHRKCLTMTASSVTQTLQIAFWWIVDMQESVLNALANLFRIVSLATSADQKWLLSFELILPNLERRWKSKLSLSLMMSIIYTIWKKGSTSLQEISEVTKNRALADLRWRHEFPNHTLVECLLRSSPHIMHKLWAWWLNEHQASHDHSMRSETQQWIVTVDN